MKYSGEHLAFLAAGYRTMTSPELTAAFNARFRLDATEAGIRCTLARKGIRCGRKTGKMVGRYLLFTREQGQFIRDRYRELSLAELTVEFNRHFTASMTEKQLRHFTRNHRVRSGRTGCFEKGIKPWNAGVTGYMGPNRTSFKKGNRPGNWKPLGTERIDARGGFILVKVAETNPYTGFPTRYKHKHVVVWEREHGPVPAGHVVAFIDGVKANCDPGNLMLITRAELLRLNQYRYVAQPAEIKPSVLALAKLEVKAFEVAKGGL